MNHIKARAEAYLANTKIAFLIPAQAQEIFIMAYEMGFKESLHATASTILKLTEAVKMTESEKRVLLETAKLIYDQASQGGQHGESKEAKA